MRIGLWKNKFRVKVYENGEEYIVEFDNGSSITTKDLSEVVFE